MLRNILKLNGVKELNKNTQSKVLGGYWFYEDCTEDDLCKCDIEDYPGAYFLQDC